MVRHLKAELVDDMRAVLGEGPAWDGETGELVTVDILSGTVHIHDGVGRRRAVYDVGGHVGSALPAANGGWLLVTGDGFAFLERDGSVRDLLAVVADQPDLRFNDAKCDPWGQALAGTMRYDETAGSATLYRLEAAFGGEPPSRFRARVLLDHLGLANGLGWSAEGDTLYFIDSLSRTVASHPYRGDGDQLGPRRVLVVIDEGQGLPDGMCVDETGGLWVALYGGGVVQRFRPDGELDTVVSLPVANPTSVAFGGVDGDRLFITTAGRQEAADGKGAGGLWAVDPGTSGRPATLWRDPTMSKGR
jgi:sugar lactone lactonase YvrE